jgi:hypothetical protein
MDNYLNGMNQKKSKKSVRYKVKAESDSAFYLPVKILTIKIWFYV